MSRARSDLLARSDAGGDQRVRRATDDPQWIHTDPERAVNGPFGTTIARVRTLSLCVPMLYDVRPPGGAMVVSYAVNRMHLPAPVLRDRVRGRRRIVPVDERGAGERATIEAAVECEGIEKPVYAADFVVLTVS